MDRAFPRVPGPASHLSEKDVTPQTLPFSEWYKRQWRLQAQCQCGRTRDVHMGAVLNLMGEQAAFTEGNARRIAAATKCIECGRRGPKLTVVDREGRAV